MGRIRRKMFSDLLKLSWYGCTKTFYSYKGDTMTTGGDIIALHAQESNIKSFDNYDPQFTYEKPGSLEPEAFQFQNIKGY